MSFFNDNVDDVGARMPIMDNGAQYDPLNPGLLPAPPGLDVTNVDGYATMGGIIGSPLSGDGSLFFNVGLVALLALAVFLLSR